YTLISVKRKVQAVSTFVELKIRIKIVKRLHGRDSQFMTQAVLELASQLQDKLKTLTVDHGKEFANYQTIERRTGTQVYFAHAYSPHERGSN
ncbi:IS30 family transposase, partial [Staphylococcus epidermidis]